MDPIVEIYTDGAASGNPGPGGYGAVLKFAGKRREISEGFRLTTNNRMELLAVIVALEHLKTNKYPVVVYSDSRYVVDAINKRWVFGWEVKQFNGKANPDLWIRFLKVYRQFKDIRFVWVKGHASNVENNRCDELAVAASRKPGLGADPYFEKLRRDPTL
ncbi:MAG: ribonuclease HI [Bacteroidia bacterium]|nr:ribonuclease HI [Bacteroidia bacterium]